MPAAPLAPHAFRDLLPRLLLALWAIGFVTLAASWSRRWWTIRTAIRSALPLPLGTEVSTISSPAFLEPGVFGIFRPILLVPEGIEEQLTGPQWRAIIAHELCHIRRRDNLAAAIHMLVEAVFWFHPLVWWLGARLMQERETACDEEVLRLGHEPESYAEGILKICELSLAPPLPFVAGVTGANLKHRIEAIMSRRLARPLSFVRKIVLAMAGTAAIAVPVAIGVLNAPPILAQSNRPRPAFEVASVKPVDRATMSRDHEGRQLDAGRFVDRTDLLQFLVRAYIDVAGAGCITKTALGEDCPFVTGNLPAWIKTDRWEIEAKLPAISLPSHSVWQQHVLDTPQINQMLQVLLEDRFRLRVHREMKDLAVYALTVGKNGPKLQPTKGQLTKADNGSLLEVHGLRGIETPTAPDGTPRTKLTFQASSLADAAAGLSWYFDRPVLDQTGIEGNYDFTVEFEKDAAEPGPATSGNASGLGGAFFNPFTGLSSAALSAALQDVGLRLESTRAQVQVLVVDHVEKPSGN